MAILIIIQAPMQGTECYRNELNNCGDASYTGKEGVLERENDRNSLVTPGEALWVELCNYVRGHITREDVRSLQAQSQNCPRQV